MRWYIVVYVVTSQWSLQCPEYTDITDCPCVWSQSQAELSQCLRLCL